MTEDFKTWFVGTGSMGARLNWFGTSTANSEFFLKVAKPLISIHTVISINVERKVNPIKYTIMTNKCNHLKDPKGFVLYRAQKNLKHGMRAKKALEKKITDSL